MALGERPVSERSLRMLNEVPALFTVFLVALAVLKPF
jgi:putative membrane protein